MSSVFLSRRALAGLQRLGDMMIPGGYGLPSFSQTGCIAHVDIVLEASHPADVRDLSWLLVVISLASAVVLRTLLNWLDKSESVPAPLASVLRLLNVGLKGVVYSLYYADLQGDFVQAPSVHEALGYQVNCGADAPLTSSGEAQ
ncbi:MAG: hypothetical protein H6999_05410 [Hahellaceae bacterium]|nr:hypothetical protein [Hahellaceae bacterium]MCP5169176.1 hypothetical protein [Hahellaceae bacterium]